YFLVWSPWHSHLLFPSHGIRPALEGFHLEGITPGNPGSGRMIVNQPYPVSSLDDVIRTGEFSAAYLLFLLARTTPLPSPQKTRPLGATVETDYFQFNNFGHRTSSSRWNLIRASVRGIICLCLGAT